MNIPTTPTQPAADLPAAGNASAIATEAIPTEELDKFLGTMVKSSEGISDLLFVAGKPPQVEIHGRLKPFDAAAGALASAGIERLARAIMNNNPRLVQDLAETGSCDCSYSLREVCRFRINIFRQNGNYAMVLRRLQSQIPSMDSLQLAPVFREIIKEKTGLVFVTGGTGSGKTTTLGRLDERNQPDGPTRTSSRWRTRLNFSTGTTRPRSASANWGAIFTIFPPACAPHCGRRRR